MIYVLVYVTCFLGVRIFLGFILGLVFFRLVGIGDLGLLGRRGIFIWDCIVRISEV